MYLALNRVTLVSCHHDSRSFYSLLFQSNEMTKFDQKLFSSSSFSFISKWNLRNDLMMKGREPTSNAERPFEIDEHRYEPTIWRERILFGRQFRFLFIWFQFLLCNMCLYRLVKVFFPITSHLSHFFFFLDRNLIALVIRLVAKLRKSLPHPATYLRWTQMICLFFVSDNSSCLPFIHLLYYCRSRPFLQCHADEKEKRTVLSFWLAR